MKISRLKHYKIYVMSDEIVSLFGQIVNHNVWVQLLYRPSKPGLYYIFGTTYEFRKGV